MPAQKRPYEAPSPAGEDDSLLRSQNHNHEHADDPDDDSDGSRSSSAGEMDEFVIVKLAEVRKEVQCPICLGIIRKTRTVMECLHRFCRECIDKSMRLGNNECPACRAHCASRRSLRDDPNYDTLIAALYPDIDKYEAEELAFHEEEKARNKQIQALIAQTSRRQSEILRRKRSRATASEFVRRSTEFVRRQGNYRTLKGRRGQKAAELQGSDNEDDANGHDGGKESSSADEPCTDVKPKRYKRWGVGRFPHPSLAAGNADGGSDEKELEYTRESLGVSAGLVGSSEMLAWGGGGMRSNTRHGSMSGGNGKSARNSRISKLIDHLRNLRANDDESEIHLTLVALDEQRIPNLQEPHLCCNPNFSVRHICQYVAIQTSVEADEVQMLLVKGDNSKLNPLSPPNVSGHIKIDPFKDELHILEEHETVAGLQSMYNFSKHNLLLAYRKKLSGTHSV